MRLRAGGAGMPPRACCPGHAGGAPARVAAWRASLGAAERSVAPHRGFRGGTTTPGPRAAGLLPGLPAATRTGLAPTGNGEPMFGSAHLHQPPPTLRAGRLPTGGCRCVGFAEPASRTCPAGGLTSSGTRRRQDAGWPALWVSRMRARTPHRAERNGMAVLGRLGLMEVGVAIAALMLLGAVGAALAVERARRKDTPEVGDPYEVLYPGRHERRAPVRRNARGSPRGEGAGHPRQDR
jgi:hypothetical protein